MENAQRIIMTAAAVVVSIAAVTLVIQQMEPRQSWGEEMQERSDRIHDLLNR